MTSLSGSFRQNFIRMSPPAKLILLVFMVLVFALFGSLLAMLIAMPLYGYDFVELSGIVTNPDSENIGVIKFFQIFQSITLFIIPSLIAAWLFSTNAAGYLQSNRKFSWLTVLMVMLSIISAIPFLNKITELNMQMDLPEQFNRLEEYMKSMEESAARLTELFLKSDSTTDLMVNFVMIAILPAIGEELLFRGVVQRLFTDWTRNQHVGVILSAFLFSFIHFQFYGFIPRLLLGLFFGYLLLWSGSIWVPIIGHLINNGLAVLYYHFAKGPVGETTMDTIGTGSGNYLIYLSVFVTSLLIGMIYLHEKSNRESAEGNFI